MIGLVVEAGGRSTGLLVSVESSFVQQSVALVVKFFIDIRYSVKLWNLGMA